MTQAVRLYKFRALPLQVTGLSSLQVRSETPTLSHNHAAPARHLAATLNGSLAGRSPPTMAAPSPVVPQSADKENDGTSSIEAGVAALCSPATSGGGRKRSVPLDDRRPQAADRTPSDVPGVKRHRGNTGSPAAAEDQQAHAAGLAAPSPTQQQHQPEEASSQPSPALEPAGEAEVRW